MTELVVQPGRTRRVHSEQFKQQLVDVCLQPGMSLANIARQHGLHPNLLSRWVKERQPADGRADKQAEPLPRFVPVRIASAQCAEQSASPRLSSEIEVNIDRGDLRIAFKVDSAQMIQLGQMLREVLR